MWKRERNRNINMRIAIIIFRVEKANTYLKYFQARKREFNHFILNSKLSTSPMNAWHANYCQDIHTHFQDKRKQQQQK